MKDLAIQREEEMQEDMPEMVYPRLDDEDMDEALEYLSRMPFMMHPSYVNERQDLVNFLNYLDGKYGSNF